MDNTRQIHYVITIMRQFGSLGRPIARRLSEKLGIEYYDRDIVDRTAREMNLPVSTVSELEEAAHKKFFSMKYPLGSGTTATQDEIFQTQRMIIQKIATKESCIIVGRCADSILREFPNTLHIYIYAPWKERVQVTIKRFGYSPEEAAKMVNDVDAARTRYHRQYTGFLPDDPDYKTLMVDSSILGVEGTADLLEQYVKNFLAHRNDPEAGLEECKL